MENGSGGNTLDYVPAGTVPLCAKSAKPPEVSVKGKGKSESVRVGGRREVIWVATPGPRRSLPPSSPSRDAPPDLEGEETLLKHHTHIFKR